MSAGFIKSDTKRVKVGALNTVINKEVLENFKSHCKMYGYPMNVMLETFMQQYANGRFKISHDEIMKWKEDDSEEGTLNTTFSKEIYTNFKFCCKDNGYYVRYVLTAFMYKYSNGELILEFTEIKTKEGN